MGGAHATFKTYTFPLEGEALLEFNLNFPRRTPKGQGLGGIYMYINTISKAFYVGSSTVLGTRVRMY